MPKRCVIACQIRVGCLELEKYLMAREEDIALTPVPLRPLDGCIRCDHGNGRGKSDGVDCLEALTLAPNIDDEHVVDITEVLDELYFLWL